MWRCACGYVSRSKPGRTLHGQRCEKAKADAIPYTELVLPDAPLPHTSPEVREFEEAIRDALDDIRPALDKPSKSAARRARKALLRVRNSLLPLRKVLLAVSAAAPKYPSSLPTE